MKNYKHKKLSIWVTSSKNNKLSPTPLVALKHCILNCWLYATKIIYQKRKEKKNTKTKRKAKVVLKNGKRKTSTINNNAKIM